MHWLLHQLFLFFNDDDVTNPEFLMMMSPPRIQAPRSLFLKEISVSMRAATRGLVGSEFSWGRNLGHTHTKYKLVRLVNQFHPCSYMWLGHTMKPELPGGIKPSLFTCTHFSWRKVCLHWCFFYSEHCRRLSITSQSLFCEIYFPSSWFYWALAIIVCWLFFLTLAQDSTELICTLCISLQHTAFQHLIQCVTQTVFGIFFS